MAQGVLGLNNIYTSDRGFPSVYVVGLLVREVEKGQLNIRYGISNPSNPSPTDKLPSKYVTITNPTKKIIPNDLI